MKIIARICNILYMNISILNMNRYRFLYIFHNIYI